MVTFRISVLLPIAEHLRILNYALILIPHHIQESYTFENGPVFIGPPCISRVGHAHPDFFPWWATAHPAPLTCRRPCSTLCAHHHYFISSSSLSQASSSSFCNTDTEGAINKILSAVLSI